jgi:putative ABC transport system permease protein
MFAAMRYWRNTLSVVLRYSLGQRPRTCAGLSVWRHDLAYAVRSLSAAPAFSIAAVLTLSVGIGANTAIFSMLHAVVLADLPYHDPARLVVLWTLNIRQNIPDGSSYLNVRDWQDQSRQFEAMAVYRRPEFTRATLTGTQEADRVYIALVGPGFFDVLGAAPDLGRTFHAGDFRGAHRSVIISHSLWRQRFGGTPHVIGAQLDVDGVPSEIVGVMPHGFEFPNKDVQLWQPISVMRQWEALQSDPRTRDADMLVAIGRLTPGATLETARAELDTIAARLRAAYPDSNAGLGVVMHRLTDHVLGARTERSLWLLFGAVMFVLLIACANVANLVLARGSSRIAEFSLRTALGASRARLVCLMLTENVVLALVSSAVGLVLAGLIVKLLASSASAALPRLADVRLDADAFLFALAVAATCGFVAGLLPAVPLSRMSQVERLGDASGRQVLGSHRLRRLRQALVVAELALAVMLLAGAGVLIRSFIRVQAIDRGFDSAHTLLLQIDLGSRYDGPRAIEYFRNARTRLKSLPGIADAGATSNFFISRRPDLRVTLEGRPEGSADDAAPPLIRDWVVPGYFETMRIPLVSGRYLQDADLRPDAPDAVVINEEMARRFWPGEDALGKRLKFGRAPAADAPWATVVGIVSNMKRQGLEEPAIPCLFEPGISTRMDLVVRTMSDPSITRDMIQAELRALDPAIPPYGIVATERRLGDTVAMRTLQTILLGALSAAALILAVIGVYGIVHHAVAARTREIGVRMALGADRTVVQRMVLGHALRLCGAGLALGLIGALALARTLGAFVYQTSAVDPVTYVTVITLLAGITTIACLVPARRASRIDPVIALRCE